MAQPQHNPADPLEDALYSPDSTICISAEPVLVPGYYGHVHLIVATPHAMESFSCFVGDEVFTDEL